MATKKKTKKVIDYDPLAWLDEEAKEESSVSGSQDVSATEADASVETVSTDAAPETASADQEPDPSTDDVDPGYGFFDEDLKGASKPARLDENDDAINLGVELTIRSIAECKALIDEQYSSGESVKLDAAELQKIDSAGLQMIYSLKKTLEKNHRNLEWLNISQVINDGAGALGLPGLCNEQASSGFGFFDEQDSTAVEQSNDDGFGFF